MSRYGLFGEQAGRLIFRQAQSLLSMSGSIYIGKNLNPNAYPFARIISSIATNFSRGDPARAR